MMDDILILMNEVENDGRTVHLYFSPYFKRYIAYGISAYIITRMAHGVECYYDDDMQMPMVKMSDSQLKRIGSEVRKIVANERNYWRMEAILEYDEKGYAEWAGFLRRQFTGRN